MRPWLLSCCIIALLASCKPNEEQKQAFIRTEVEKKLNALRKKKLEECAEFVRTRSDAWVDSVLVAQAKDLRDSFFFRPPIPAKPAPPSGKLPSDTLEFKPMLGRRPG